MLSGKQLSLLLKQNCTFAKKWKMLQLYKIDEGKSEREENSFNESKNHNATWQHIHTIIITIKNDYNATWEIAIRNLSWRHVVLKMHIVSKKFSFINSVNKSFLNLWPTHNFACKTSLHLDILRNYLLWKYFSS